MPQRKSFNLRLPPPMHAAVRARAWLGRVSMTAWIAEAIQAALDHKLWPETPIEISIPQIVARHLGDALTPEQVDGLIRELRKGKEE